MNIHKSQLLCSCPGELTHTHGSPEDIHFRGMSHVPGRKGSDSASEESCKGGLEKIEVQRHGDFVQTQKSTGNQT